MANTAPRFNTDLKREKLPQWSFVTPNLVNDGHDTSIAVSCKWTRDFVESLLANKYFNKDALIYITWQANGQYPKLSNHVAGILLGSAIDKKLVGTVDNSYYNHYSEISSIEANWELHHLGRWDVGANVWKFVGDKTKDVIRRWSPTIAKDSFENYFWNQSYGGVFSSASTSSHLYVKPNLGLVHNRRTILPAIARVWQRSNLPSYYRDIIELPDALHPPKGYEVRIGLEPSPPITTPIFVYPV